MIASMAQRVGPGWLLVVPVRGLINGKSRLGPNPALRAAAIVAFTADTIEAALASPSVQGLVVVSDDSHIHVIARKAGALTTHEPSPDLGSHASTPANNGLSGLNAAVEHGARFWVEQVHATTTKAPLGIAALLGDLPGLQPSELTDALALAELHARAHVPDADGTGTTLLTARWQEAHSGMGAQFGNDSSARHCRAGVPPLQLPQLPELVGLRRDVDRLEDLDTLAAHHVGRHTEQLQQRSWVLPLLEA